MAQLTREVLQLTLRRVGFRGAGGDFGPSLANFYGTMASRIGFLSSLKAAS